MMLRAVLALTLAIPLTALAAEMAPSPGQISLTIAQSGSAQIHDRRSVSLDRGPSSLVFDGVARDAIPGSAVLAGPGMRVLEQGFDPDGLTPERMLAASVGREVTVFWRDSDGTERGERAKVLAVRPQPVFQVAGKVTAASPARIVFDALPPCLRATPSFRAVVESEAAGSREIDLLYRGTGLSWTSDATAELSGDRMSLTVWAGLTNASGADFTEARVRLLAGALNQAPEMEPRGQSKAMRAMAVMAAPPMADAPREAVGGYHLYTVERPVTLRDGETRQVPLFSARSVAVKRHLVLGPQPPHVLLSRQADRNEVHPVQVLEFSNSAASGLGNPLPGGLVRVVERAADGRLVPVGEDLLPPLPEGRSGRIALGEAFDVTARRVQTDFQRLGPDSIETATSLRLANGGDHPVQVTVKEAVRGDWQILEESLRHQRDDASTVRWLVEVPAKGEATLTFRVRTKA